MNEHMRRRRQDRVSFTLSPDAVHPDATGHLMMALLLLETWHAPAEVATAEIDASALRAVRGEVSKLARTDDGLRFNWRTILPWPADPRWDADSFVLEQVAARFNRQTLIVRQAAAARYRLLADDTELAVVTREELVAGINLTELAASPATAKSQEVLKLIVERNRLVYDAWRKRIAGQEGTAKLGKAERRAAAIDDELRVLCQPLEMSLRLAEVSDVVG